MNETQARTLREAHASYERRIVRMTKAQLTSLYRNDLSERGGTIIYGGPATKDELIGALLNMHYPLAKLNESIHVLYHVDGITNDICAYCNPNPCPACGALEACDYDSENGPVVNGRHVIARVL